MALAEAIASQQLSVEGRRHDLRTLLRAVRTGQDSGPERLLALDDEAIRGAGFSRSKVVFLRDLATHVVDKRLALDRLHELEDCARARAIDRGERHRAVDRGDLPDVPPAAAGRVSGRRSGPGEGGAARVRPAAAADRGKRLLKMAEAWRPYRSIAAWYLWRSLSADTATELSTKNEARTERRTTNAQH